jgi:hypothetical protein
MNIKYAISAVVGIGVGYLLAFNKLERNRYDGYNEGYEEAKERYNVSCARCEKRDVELAAMSDEEFAASSEAFQAATEAMKQYEGTTIVSSVLPGEMTATVEKAVERNELEVVKAHFEAAKKEVEDLVKLTEPIVKKLIPQTPTDPPVNYNRISTPAKTEKTDEPKTTESESENGTQVELVAQKSFIDDEFGYKQYTFVYYEGDDVLSNEKEDPVEGEARRGVGEEALRKLKEGGSDSIYVRNHDGKWDFEIVRDSRKFSDVVGPRNPSG